MPRKLTDDQIRAVIPVINVVADRIRLMLLCLLDTPDGCTRTAIRELSGLSFASLAYHLAILKASGGVETAHRGRTVTYRITPLGIAILEAAVGLSAAVRKTREAKP